MAPETQATHRETQEQSIKARKTELFEEENSGEEGGLMRPFRAYLADTPAAPLSLGIKASLWSTGVVVALLFVGAMMTRKNRATAPEGLIVRNTAKPALVAVNHSTPQLVVPSHVKDEKKVDKPKDEKKDEKSKDKKPKDKNKKPKDKNKKPKAEAVAKAEPNPKNPTPTADELAAMEEAKSIRFDQFTMKSQEAVQRAQGLALDRGHRRLEPMHLLVTLLDPSQSMVQKLLGQIGVPPAQVLEAAEEGLKALPKLTKGETTVGPDLIHVFAAATAEAEQTRDKRVTTEHLLLAITKVKSKTQELLASLGVDEQAILQAKGRSGPRVADQNPGIAVKPTTVPAPTPAAEPPKAAPVKPQPTPAAEPPKAVHVKPQPAPAPAATANTGETTPNEPAKKTASPIFRKKKAPKYTYPKKEPMPKKDQADDPADSSTAPK